ncbi:concanavalin A-like lectin/glucanase domain-containing protein [Lentinula aff. detonsa]|uniref:Concanavalin A-like lectin/glucanase domain-containing protein n=1 Tax=Lentinula aff. detonsa TaxID=2804958 RepID=A0AA38L600_9AGAR|nr:concanavalin A-like lectin/glucanase domain-containing protein [Lentinula aff. detonsa]
MMKLSRTNLHNFLPVEAFLLVTFLGASHASTSTSCSCGYIDDQGHVWREAITTEFTQPSGALAALGNDWIVSTDNEPQSGSATANIQYIEANVLEHNSALGIQASAHTSGSSSVHSGEIFTERSDLLYGTFRMRAVVPTVPGVVFGFFSYESDTQEQDIEFLSSDDNSHQHVQYTNQPGTINGEVDNDAYRDVDVSGANFTAFGEHRFDWLETATEYYYNSNLTATITKNVPTSPSEIVLNVWSNGDPEFSQGPPTSNATATVEYIKLYFNSTSLTEAKFSQACSEAGNIARCSI